MFRDFLIDKLSDEANTFLIVGESHNRMSSATYALESCIPQMKNAINKDCAIIYITEDLPRIKHDQSENSYTYQDILSLSEIDDREKSALCSLIEAGVRVYGVETTYTDPFINFSFRKGPTPLE